MTSFTDLLCLETGTKIDTGTDTETRIGTRIMIEKYGVKGPIYQNQD